MQTPPRGIYRAAGKISFSRAAAIMLLLLLACGTASAFREGEEYQIKAAFVVNFMKFVQWPEGPAAQPKGELTLCNLGQGPLMDHQASIEGQTINTRRLVLRSATLQGIKNCSALFIPKTEADRLNQALKAAQDLQVLTITDIEEPAGRAAVINMYIENNKVRFEINQEAARRSGVLISSHLLRLARKRGVHE